MPITERMLKEWRYQALLMEKTTKVQVSENVKLNKDGILTLCDRILRMTAELLDEHLLRRVK